MYEGDGLARFVFAQEAVYDRVLRELEAGRKDSHWIWFIFPQLRGLGRSRMADFYGIAGREEAAAYLAHRTLGTRLTECTATLLKHEPVPISTLLPPPDDLKFRSSMTLFAAVAGDDASLFRQALGTWFGGADDPLTVALL
jgi:uncharacterized protein (DUF1810 family)